MPDNRHTVTGSNLVEAAGYGARVAAFLRSKLGYCAHKKLATLLDISTRQAERLLRVSLENRGPTIEQLLLLHVEYGPELLRAVFVEAALREDRRLTDIEAERAAVIKEIAALSARRDQLDRDVASALFRRGPGPHPDKVMGLLVELIDEVNRRHSVKTSISRLAGVIRRIMGRAG